MAFVKSQLKLARDSLSKKDYISAKTAAGKVLDYEPENYTGTVFLGLALLELGELDESEQAYRKAIDLNPDQQLAWQGISKFYERTEKWDQQAEALEKLLNIYANIQDSVKCAETIQKLVELRRNRGNRAQVVEALSSLLPDSSIFGVLSSLPQPDATNPTSTTIFEIQCAVYNSLPVLEEMVALVEQEEEEILDKEVARRRTRLGASGPEQLKKEVGREIWSRSRLPDLYNEILNHPNTSDELRRETDSKLIRFKQRYLHSLPATGDSTEMKIKVAQELDDLVNGVVLLQIPDELAWMIFLENTDIEDIAGYDYQHIRHFIKLFPSSDMAVLLKRYMCYTGTQFIEDDEEENVLDADSPRGMDDDPIDIIMNAYPTVSNTIIANRILAEIHLNEEDYENAIKVSKSGLELLAKTEIDKGKKLNRMRTGLQVVLATSLVHLFPPKHHARALPIIDEVLAHSPTNIMCLMDRAYILQEAKRWSDAAVLFEKVDGLIPGDGDSGLRAREEGAWCRCQIGELDAGVAVLQSVLDILSNMGDRDFDSARCLWRIGRCHWDMGGTQREEAYSYFIASLKRNHAFAPAFTSLGLYYSECASPPDPIRASKCFQKAFELDPREATAAQRLAEGFAEDNEWDLVEVVARRTIEGEGGLDAGLKGDTSVSTKYLPVNAWAWKAVGVVELNRKNYPPAIHAFQVALRADPDDQLSWLHLGEAYSKAGRHAAAIKSLTRAQDLKPDDWICSYFIGDVKHRMGLYQEAVFAYESILRERPSEAGVLASLGQAYLDLGRTEMSDGLQMRSETSFVHTVRTGLMMVEQSHGFRGVAWKLIGDAAFSLSHRSTYVDEASVYTALVDVLSHLSMEVGGQLKDILPLPSLPAAVSLTGVKALEIAIFAYDDRISLDATGQVSSASAWFDLGVALHSWNTSMPQNNNSPKVMEKAIQCLTKALREDPENDAFWAALGNAQFASQAKAAQHAYIKALEIDAKNVATWTNLGLLYFHHGDLELANEALYRAQILDSDFTLAWVGQALVATANGHDVDASVLLDHAVSLPTPVSEADYEYAWRVFSKFKTMGYGHRASLDVLLPAFFVLDRYCIRRPDDSTGLHLFGLICETIGHLQFAEELVKRAISILETVYEETEDPLIEKQYIIANSTLGRLRLSLGNFAGALESFESALGLSSDDDETSTRLLLVQLHFGSGVAYFMQGDLHSALNLFQAALDAASDDLTLRGQITVLLAQTMWAIGTDELKESAKTILLECISADPGNLTAINTLTGMGILADDGSLVDAALSEILALPLEQRNDMDPQRDVDYVLIQHHLGQGNLDKAFSVAQNALFAEPSNPNPRRKLANLALQMGEPKMGLALLSDTSAGGDLQAVPPLLCLRAVAQSTENKSEEPRREAERAIMLAPSEIRNWQTLAYVQSCAT